MKKRKRKKLISFSFKFALSFLLIMFVLEKIDVKKLTHIVKNADYIYFAIAFVMITIAQVYGALRMRYNLSKAEFTVSRTYSIGMYFLGTLFNIVLPGGIGGDGYRAYYFHKRFKFPWQKTLMAILRGRSSGLLFLCIFLIACAFFYKDHLTVIPYIDYVLIASAVLIFPAYSILTRLVLREPLKVQLGGMKYSFASQVFFLLATVAVLYGIGVTDKITGYIFVFLIANIVAVIPISFGGIGLREFTYVTLAEHIGLNSDIGVTTSLLYYLIYTSVAFLGLIPYVMLRKMDYHELKYQRRINFTKYAVVEEKPEVSPEQLEAAQAYAGD